VRDRRPQRRPARLGRRGGQGEGVGVHRKQAPLKPLQGTTVVDLTAALAGPYATFLLAALGARVIKVESPHGGDRVRSHPPFAGPDGVVLHPHAEDDMSVPFLSRGRGKESVTLDLKHADGPRVFADLVRGADVVVENFSSGTADRLGVGYETCRAANPRIVYCAVSGFGADALRGAGAYDTVIQALSGIMLLSGDEGDPPVKIGMPFADLVAPLFGVIGLLAALRVRDVTGEGQFVDVSMLGAVTSLVASEPFELLERLGIPARTGNSTVRLTPFGVFRTADGHVAICATNDHECERLFREMGRPELLDEDGFATVAARVANHRAVEAAVEGWTSARATAEVVASLEAAGVAVAPVREPKEAVKDEEVLRRGETATLAHPSHGVVEGAVGPGLPIRFSRSESTFGLPPTLGEHNDRVYTEVAGYTPETVAELRSRGVI
jgi:crotonobetainyl-CoA:carnitine CoA-transferase CaiB-like acyl-CoA transferase